MPSKICEFLSLSNQRLFGFVLLLSILPMWLVDYPPMVDIPQHAAQINALHQIWQGNSVFTDVFEIYWFTPYLVGNLLVYVFTLLFPITVAIKIVISLSILAIPILSGVFFQETGADERWKWLVIPSSISFVFYLGFLNYFVAMPLSLLFLIYTVRFNRNTSLKNGFIIALYSVLLFFCHILALGYASLLALMYLTGAHYRNSKALLLRCLPYAVPLPLIVIWMVSAHSNELTISGSPFIFGYDWDRLKLIVENLSGSDSYSIPFGLLASILIIAFPFVVRAKFNQRPERWLPLTIGTLVYLVFPSYAFGTSVLYHRFGAFLAPLWFMVWDPPETKSVKWHWVAITMVCLWASMNIFRFNLFDRDIQHFEQIMSAMEPEKKVLSMIVETKSPYFLYPVYLHFPSWYQAKRNGTVDFNFAAMFPAMVRYKPDKWPYDSDKWPKGWGWPARFRWDEHRGELYDYFIIHANKDMSEELFKDRRDAVTLKTNSGWWWLYEKKKNNKYSETR